jgi:hypothetical protein
MKTITYNDEDVPWSKEQSSHGRQNITSQSDVITFREVITSSLKPLWEPLDWDNGQPEHICDWDYLAMHTFVPCP